MPPYRGYNIIDWHIYDRLRSLWKNESKSWSQGEYRDFVRSVPTARITERENTIANHRLAVYMRRNRPSWGHFVILRAMFGASQCARQPWWANFKQKYGRATEDAPPGVVPRDVDEVLEANRMEAPPIMNIPTMEVKQNHVDEDCRCAWCVKNEEKTSRRSKKKKKKSGSVNVNVKTEQVLDYTREHSIYTGEGETCKDRARRWEREQGVEPEEIQDDDDDDDDDSDGKMDDELSDCVTQTPCVQEASADTGASNGRLREMVMEQGGKIETLVQLLEKQHETIERLMSKVEREQERSKGYYRDIRRRMRSLAN